MYDAFKFERVYIMIMHWREKQLVDVLQDGKLTTSNILDRVNMSRVTALKYLVSLQERNVVTCEEVGPVKIWSLGREDQKIETRIKVLVVDDEMDVINIIRESLDPNMFEIIEAFNGKEALGMVFAESPDIIILDSMMPIMDGYGVCQELKKNAATKNLPIIILSAKTDVDDKLNAMEVGINDYITKPFDPRELEARIKMVLRMDFGMDS